MTKKNVLIIENLNKTYSSKNSSKVDALKNFNLQVKEGEIFGLLGPNGAGKSTFINILAGTVIKTSGKVEIWGFNLDRNPRQAKASIGIVPQEVNVDPFFNPRDLLDLQAGLYGVKKKDRITDTILKMVSLEGQATTYTRRLSGGMKRRLMVAKALVHQPPIVILDEPTAGVDVELRKNLWDNVKNLKKNGVTTILTTHYLNEAEEVCDRIGIIDKGKMVALDTAKNLISKIQTKIINFQLTKHIEIEDNFLNSTRIISNKENLLSLSYEKSKLNFDQIISFIKSKNVDIIDISTDDGNLEDVFLKLTNH